MNQPFMRHLYELAHEIGERPHGSRANRKATEYLYAIMDKAGLIVRRLTYPTIDWRVSSCTLLLEHTELVAYPNGFCISGSTHAPLKCACTLDELRRTNCDGAFLLLYGDLSQNGLQPRPIGTPVYYPKDSRQINDCLERSRPLALLLAGPDDRQRSLHNDPYFPIPSLTLPHESALAVLNAPSPTLSLDVQTSRAETTS